MAEQLTAVQGTLDDLGTPLSRCTFVIVDLETTGTRSDGAGITEIGAVKVRGGEVLGEFATLVNPGAPIPPFITLLTGITQAMVAPAPDIAAALPAFLEFAGLDSGAILVAHNAPFDVGFLKAACAEHGYPWPAPQVLDTVALARRLVTRDEVPNHKLGTLAGFFGVPDQPTHRALDDARATVGVLHGLLERLGSFGVDTAEELRSFRSAPTAAQRAKRRIADGVPEAPGVYVFTDAKGDTLYVGKSTNLRRRVRSYFTGSEKRARIREMAALVEGVTPIVCGTGLEAEVRELRLIAERKPPYNRRSRNPERAPWLKLTREVFPRLSVVRSVRDDGAPYLGPFRSSREAELAREALHQVFRLRQCTRRIVPGRPTAPCVLAQLGRCGAPCAGGESPEEYAAHADTALAAMTADPAPVVEHLSARIAELAADLRYEEAAGVRDRLTAFVSAAARAQRLGALAAVPELVAAAPAPAPPGSGARPGWEVHVIRHGRLAAGGLMPPGADPAAFVSALVRTAESVFPGPGPAPSATPGEMECVLRWLERPGVRLAEATGTWTCPVNGAEKYRHLTDWDRGVPAPAPHR
ncbi:DEDD exonuclease domain-containing protein [Streptomonospora sp. S1-112]|uniref:DEDD exonuclease domain-containing protein n=1 Tax=Streptomonospora mangrovi TaxID=2883123 RepID=A0A9X3NNL6_9ACTN|nr:DEDD exonuclease domain-containing protein [Streptomonospora mangrovi]MDA0565443.1 DEDD exonuclease domain-containing protein [Streptomonospora mangrovi]